MRRPPLIVAALLLAACSGPRPSYVVPEVAVTEPAFARALEAHTLSAIVGGNRAEILLNGDQIFPAMLAAIRGARHTITFANYVYQDGAIAHEMAQALAERCRAGVGVNVLLDAIGSRPMPREYRETMERSGCHVTTFHPVSPLSLQRVNNRNHRRVLVVDGRIGFTGGTGVGTQWTGDGRTPGHWRQTDIRVEGPIVRFLQAAFAELWREATGILLGGDAYFPAVIGTAAGLAAQSVKSSPIGGSAEAYTLFRLAIGGARKSIYITTPYFVPDEDMLAALVAAAQRGTQVEVITAGVADTFLDRLVRQASQAMYGPALQGGVRIHEYGPARLHSKTLVVDGEWVSIGSANLDNRSFELNYELNVTFHDRGLAAQLEQIFRHDLAYTRAVTYEEWRHRGLGHVLELFLLPLKDQL